MLPSPDESPQALNEAVDEALDHAPRAQEWQTYIAALERRRTMLLRDFEMLSDPTEREPLQKQLDELDAQLQVLREEESISRFVEDATKFSYEVRRLSEG